MRHSYSALFLLIYSFILSGTPFSQQVIGTNLQWLGTQSNEWVFTDIMKNAPDWFTLSKGGGDFTHRDSSLKLRVDGYPASIDANKSVVAMIYNDIDGRYPAGEYLCLYDGQGIVEIEGDLTVTLQEAGSILFDITPGDEGIFFFIHTTVPADPIRNVRIIMPGFHETYQNQVFHPAYLEFLKPFSAIRFMNWQMIQSSISEHWEDRTTPSYYTQGGERGAALEYMIRLSNEAHADPWFCMPHLADDDYIRNFAQMVRDSLNADLKVYIEYSNEVFNPDSEYMQHYYAQQMALDSGFTTNEYDASFLWYAHRSVQIFNIWEDVFGSTDRLVRVLGTQQGNPYGTELILNFRKAWQHADALGPGFYFTFNFDNFTDSVWVEDLKTKTVDDIIDSCYHLIDTLIAHTHTLKLMADEKGLDLVSYEGGQHLTGFMSYGMDPVLADLFHAANRDPRMYDIYTKMLTARDSIGCGILMHFNSVVKFQPWGAFGVKEYMDQPLSEAHKYRAIKDYFSASSIFYPFENPDKPFSITPLIQTKYFDCMGRSVYGPSTPLLPFPVFQTSTRLH